MNIEEIKAREQAATPGPWHTEKVYHDEPGYEKFIKSARVSTEPDENHSTATITMNNWSNPAINDLEFIAHARTDIPELIAEVERLTAKLDILTGIEAQEHQQIATLKKALRLLSKHYVNSNFMNTSPKSIYDAFIQQAQQTHKTQEAEK